MLVGADQPVQPATGGIVVMGLNTTGGKVKEMGFRVGLGVGLRVGNCVGLRVGKRVGEGVGKGAHATAFQKSVPKTLAGLATLRWLLS